MAMASHSGLLLAALLVLPAWADNPAPKTPAPPPQADPELIEFIGSWQGANGQWVDPMTFASIDPAKLKAAHDGKPKDDKAPNSDGGRGT